MSTPVQQLFDLSGRFALVTGGSRGLGLQMAEALGEAGAKIMLTSRKAADLEEAVADLQAKGIDARWIAADASDPAQIQRVVDETMERFGRIDILINNAGATWGAPAEDHPLEAWDKVMNLNVRSLFLFAQAVAKASMIPNRSGRIINVQGRGRQLHAHAGRRVGALRHHGQRAGAGLLSQQDDAGRAGRVWC
jgi:gluconate 5-dehydrogenase